MSIVAHSTIQVHPETDLLRNLCQCAALRVGQELRGASQTAYRWFREAKLPVPAQRLPTGTIIVASSAKTGAVRLTGTG